jgi:lipopolysaccharide transport system ATP-binding protein
VIGENGAGKSTLLKILARVAAPSSGAARVDGTVASILELGSAFHPEFTGRQNITLNAAMLGLSRSEIAARTPAIIDFSELGRFIDQPLKCYSTGMVMRLGFAIATQVEPEILIIDEALSVGDGYFQKKCMDRLRLYLDNGGTLLFCSHAMYYISAFCQRALWMRDGRIAALGEVDRVVREYEAFLLAKAGEKNGAAVPDRPEAMGPARIVDVRLPAGGDEQLYRRGDPFSVELEWQTEDPELAFHAAVSINRLDGVEVATFATHMAGREPLRGQTHHRLRLDVPELPLVKGTFTLYVYVLDSDGLHIYDSRILERAFEVASPDYTFGLIHADHTWSVHESEAETPDGGATT